MSDELKSLYPFLQGAQSPPGVSRESLLRSIVGKAAHSIDCKRRFFADNSEALVDKAEPGPTSSCDAAHLAVEFQHPVTAGRPALPAHNLCLDVARLTAVGNDVGIGEIFARQLEAHACERDALVGFSTSGNSENLLRAYRQGRKLGMTCIGLAGGNGGQMAASGLLDHCLVVATDSIHRVQEVHVACYHILWDLVHTLLADQRGLLGDSYAIR